MTNTNLNKESKAVDSTIENKEDTTKKEVATETKEEKSFTQEELDRIINKRFAKMKADFEAEKVEAERLAKLSEEERQKALFEKEKLEFEASKKAFEMQRMELEVNKQLEEKDLPGSLAKYLVAEDAETTKKNIDNISKILEKWIEGILAKKAAGSVPKVSTNTECVITKEQFFKMGIFEQSKFAEEYPDKYKEFLK